MTHIVYLIKHLDTDMKYVGITSTDLKTRWDQHRNDPNSAIYSALRTDGHRMVMEVLERCATREQALRREQEFIHELGTAAPRGWNRMVKLQSIAVKVKRPDVDNPKYRQCDIRDPRLPIFSRIDYHLEYSRFFHTPNIWEHYIIVFNSRDNVYTEQPELNEQIICVKYQWYETRWSMFNYYETPYAMTDKHLWRERFRSLAYWAEIKEMFGRCFVEEPLFLKDRDKLDLRFRSQYLHGWF
jgi:predicted GIY-YIG superfamily endonuclease